MTEITYTPHLLQSGSGGFVFYHELPSRQTVDGQVAAEIEHEGRTWGAFGEISSGVQPYRLIEDHR